MGWFLPLLVGGGTVAAKWKSIKREFGKAVMRDDDNDGEPEFHLSGIFGGVANVAKGGWRMTTRAFDHVSNGVDAVKSGVSKTKDIFTGEGKWWEKLYSNLSGGSMAGTTAKLGIFSFFASIFSKKVGLTKGWFGPAVAMTLAGLVATKGATMGSGLKNVFGIESDNTATTRTYSSTDLSGLEVGDAAEKLRMQIASRFDNNEDDNLTYDCG